MGHFPGRGLNVDAPPVDSSLARGFRAKRMPFLSCDVSASSAPANGGADVSQSRLCAVLSACVCVYLPHKQIRHVYARNVVACSVCALAWHKVHGWREGGLYSMLITLPMLQQLLLCVALPSAVDFLSVSDSRVSVCASVHCLVLLTFLKSADC